MARPSRLLIAPRTARVATVCSAYGVPTLDTAHPRELLCCEAHPNFREIWYFLANFTFGRRS